MASPSHLCASEYISKIPGGGASFQQKCSDHHQFRELNDFLVAREPLNYNSHAVGHTG